MKKFLSNGLNCRLQNVQQFMYCRLVALSLGFIIEMKRRQYSNSRNRAFVSPTGFHSTMSVYTLLNCMRTMSLTKNDLCGPFPVKIISNPKPTLPPKICAKTVLKDAKPDFSYAR